MDGRGRWRWRFGVAALGARGQPLVQARAPNPSVRHALLGAASWRTPSALELQTARRPSRPFTVGASAPPIIISLISDYSVLFSLPRLRRGCTSVVSSNSSNDQYDARPPAGVRAHR